jgi:zinc/manganese transport system permease protein
VIGIGNFLFGPFTGFGFMRMALAACIALALASGPIGILLLLRRMSLDSNVLSHAVVPGAALGFLYAGYSLAALSAGGLLTGLLVAFLTGVVVRILPRRRDGALAAFYVYSLALGVTIIALRGSNLDVMHVLFGTVLAVDAGSLILICVICSATLLIVATIYRPLSVGTFDPAFLRAVDGRVVFEAVFLVLVVLTLVASFQAFGTLLAIGPLLLPATAARCWTQRAGPGIVLAIVFGVMADFAGLLLSYYGNLPSGPAIVIAAGTMYVVSLVCSGLIQWAERPAWH